MTNYYEQQERIQEEILARLQALEDRVFGASAISDALTSTKEKPIAPVVEEPVIEGAAVGTYSKPPSDVAVINPDAAPMDKFKRE